MGLFKKKKTFTSTDSASLFDPDQITDAQQIKKQAVKQWIFEGSQRPLHDYLLAASNNGLKARWDRLYDLVQNKNIYSEYRWNYNVGAGTYSSLIQLNWKKGAEAYLKEKFPNQIKQIVHIEQSDLWELPTVDYEARKRFQFRSVHIKHFHEVLIQSNPHFTVVLVGNDYRDPYVTYGLSTYINKPGYLGYIDPLDFPKATEQSLKAGYVYINERNVHDIPELRGYARVKPLSRESYTFIKFHTHDYENLIHERLPSDARPTAELIGIDAKSFLPYISPHYHSNPYPNDTQDFRPFEWFGAEYVDVNGNMQTYYEHIPDLRDHRIGELARKYIHRIPLEAYHPIPIRVSNNDMDGDSNLLSGNSSWGKLFLNTARRNQQLQGAADRLRYDRVYAAEALAILGFDIKELISSFRDSVGGDWGKLDDVWIHLAVPKPEIDSDYDVPVINKYWHLHHYMLLKNLVANYFTPSERDKYTSDEYMFANKKYRYSNRTSNNNPYNFSSNKFNNYRSNWIRTLGSTKELLDTFGYSGSAIDDYRFKEPTNFVGKSKFDIPIQFYELPLIRKREHFYTKETFVRSEARYILAPYSKDSDFIRWAEPALDTFYKYSSTLNGWKGIGEVSQLPVLKSLLKEFTKAEQEELLQYAMQIHTYSEETVKVYRGWVKPFVKFGAIIVGIAVAVASSGGDGGSTYTALVALAKSIAVSIAINVVIKIAVSVGLISPKLAGYLQLVISVVMMAHGTGWDFSKILTAPNIMTAVNQAFNAYNKQKVFEIAETYKQIQDETVKYQTKMEELQAKQQMVDLGVAKDAQLYLNMPSYAPKVNLFETPEMMYARHDNINIVNISLGIVTNLSHGLLSKQHTPKLETVRDIQQEVEDVLLIT